MADSMRYPVKSQVRRSFSAAATQYDEHAFLQREVADRLVERLDYIKLVPQTVLDLGCGTGYLSRLLARRYPNANLVGLDLATDMLMETRRQWPQESMLARVFRPSRRPALVCGDAEALPLAAESVDLVLSSLALQWCDPLKVSRQVAIALKTSGLFMFTTLGPDTLRELREAFRGVDAAPHVNDFVDMHDIGDMLVEAGFADPVMDQEAITLTYTDLKSLLGDLKGLGAHNVLPERSAGLMGKSRWQRLVAGYEALRREGRLPATFEVIYGHAWKSGVRKADAAGTQTIGLEAFRRMVKRQ